MRILVRNFQSHLGSLGVEGIIILNIIFRGSDGIFSLRHHVQIVSGPSSLLPNGYRG
jgi:hypothetical protein